MILLKMEITKEHIDQLYTFTQKHYVEWYDLQTELVDHLANDIEQIWSKNPNLSFDEARNQSFKKFGVIGFSDVVEKRQSALYKKYWLLMWKFFKEFFSVPKVVMTLLLIAACFTTLNTIKYKNIFIIISLLILVIVQFYFVFKMFKKIKSKQKSTGKKWLFENVVSSIGGFAFFIMIPFQLYQFIENAIMLDYWLQWIIAIFIVSYGILLYIAIKIIPHKMTEYMIKNNPKYQPIT